MLKIMQLYFNLHLIEISNNRINPRPPISNNTPAKIIDPRAGASHSWGFRQRVREINAWVF